MRPLTAASRHTEGDLFARFLSGDLATADLSQFANLEKGLASTSASGFVTFLSEFGVIDLPVGESVGELLDGFGHCSQC